MFEEGQKYNGIIPQIKYLPTHAIEHSGMAGEVRHVTDDVAHNMDFSEPVETTAYRYGPNHDEFSPSVNISNGHHRLAAAKQTGRLHLPVVVHAINAKGEKLNALKAMSDEIENRIHKGDGGPITAYQGGPHSVGEEGYDNSKIGTGEGAAAYGHGHYFAEAEPIARHYRDALTRGAGNMTIDGEPFHQHYTSTDPEKRLKAKLAIAMMHGDRDIHSAIDWHRQQVMGKLSSRNLMEEDIPEYMEDLKRLKSYEENPPIIEKNKGHMHEVAIHAHPDQFLDWDRPISEQHETIRRLVGITPEYEMAHKAAQKKDTDSLLAALEGNEQYIPTRMPTRPRGSLPMDAKGEDVYRHLQEKMGSIDWPVDANRETREQYRKSASERASQHLLAHGIKGIRYLDANSRGETEQPTHNYVVFDPKDIEIKRRYAEGGYIHKGDGGEIDQPITAYHGTPHDFEQFDTSKIGTGEGAQAYGHGLYFAEHEPVAEGYRNRIAGAKYIDKRGVPVEPNSIAQDILDESQKHGIGIIEAGNLASGWSQYVNDPNSAPVPVANVLKKHGLSLQSSGRMYEVAIHAHPDHLLDWDKPLSEQSEHVKRALKETRKHLPPNAHADLGGDYSLLYGPDIRPGQFLNTMESIGGRPDSGEKLLHAAGVHGIKYLDAGSRGPTDEPTRNYVIFDHNRVSIKRKYEQGGRVAYQKGGKVEGAIWHEQDVYGVAHGGSIAKTLQHVHNPAIVEHVLNKVGAALPALDPSLMAAKAGRRY
jgi:hypothetical protein